MHNKIIQYFPLNHNGIILEVGAGLPNMGNPVFPLRALGWKIISVEPNPVFAGEYRSLGFDVLEYAAYNKDLGETEFIISPNGISNSCLDLFSPHSIGIGDLKNEFNSESAINNNLSKDFDWSFFPKAGEVRKINVNTLTLNTILKNHHPYLSKLDVIIVDVEGFEVEVMEGIDLKKYSPKVVILENIRSYPKYREYMSDNGYSLSERVDINDIYTIKNGMD